MPRFENEGFDPTVRNKNNEMDRTVPDSENFYGSKPVDLDFNNRARTPKGEGVNPCNDYSNQPSNSQQHFQSEKPQEFEDWADYLQPSENKLDDVIFEDPDDEPKKEKKNKNKKKHRLSLGKRILIFLLVIVIIIGGGIGSVLGKMNYVDKVENKYVSASDLTSSSSVKNILLLGVDARSSDKASQSRSDTMMLISLDMKHKCIKMISFLRDTWVYIPTLGYEQRLNAACSSGGYQGVSDAIEYNFGVKIDGWAVVDFEVFKVIVDSLGGVEINVTDAEAKEVTNHPKRYGNVTLKSGKYKLTGEQALAYCRIRKIDTDFERTKRQRKVMEAIIRASKSNPLKLYKMASKSAPYVETNLTKSQLIKIAAAGAVCITGKMHQTKVPFTNTWEYATIQGNSVISIDKEKNKKKLIDYIYKKSSAELAEKESKK